MCVCFVFFSLLFHAGCRMKQEKEQSSTFGQMSWLDFCGQIPPLGRCAPGADLLFSWFAACILKQLSSKSELITFLVIPVQVPSWLCPHWSVLTGLIYPTAS